ncbi:MAG: MFS transporter [Bacteroidetes bacterium]|nr:MFS transporter [Bacteroidota bacterium]
MKTTLLEKKIKPEILRNPAVGNSFFIIAPLWLTAFIVSCQLFIVAPLLPLIEDELLNPAQPSDFALGFLGTAYSILLSISTLIIGPISDLVGRRKILIWGTALISITLLLHGLATHYESLLIVRACTGVAAGVYSGSMVAFVGDYFPYNRRGWATGWIMTGVASGLIIGTPGGILLADTFGFQSPFMIFGILMGLACLMAWRFIPETRVISREESFSLIRTFNTYTKLLKTPRPVTGAFVHCLIFMSIGFFIFFFPKWLEEDLGFTIQQLALLFVIGGIGIVIGTTSGGMLSDRFGRKPIIIGSSLAMVLVLPWIAYWAQGLWSVTVLTTLALLFGAMRTGPMMALLTAITTDSKRGTLMGLVVAAGQFGLGVSTATSGWVYEHLSFEWNVIASILVILVMMGVLWKLLPEPKEN